MRVGQTVSSTLPPEARRKPAPILRDPFNSTPTTAPIAVGSQVIPSVAFPADFVPPPTSPIPVATAVAEPPGPGPLEEQLTAELAEMQMLNPTAKTQSLLALQLARAADQLDPSDIKMMLTVGKELRSLLEGLNKSPRAGGDDDDEQQLFGAVRPEIHHPPAV